jgi:DNA invertase Pin-like site-specific DNA recombinase
MNGPIPCVVYAARSMADDRDEKEKSTQSQTAEVLSKVEQEGGRVVVGEFAESGESGYHGERGAELEAAMEAAKQAAERQGEAELWVFHSSRLARGDGTKGKRSLNKIHADLLYEDVQVRSAEDDEFVRNPMLVGIASSQNNKYSVDLGAHVARGKRAAVASGKWPGGPAPDGYLIERSVVGKRTVSKLVIDPERESVVRLVFDWSEEGIGDPTIARRLNDAGHRTRKGKPWTRRLVQHILLSPVYAGRIVRRGTGSRVGGTYELLDTPEVFDGEHEALIEPERFDRINAARDGRDFMKKGRAKSHAERGKRGGRPTTLYALARLAKCDRCGEQMYASTSTYRRKSDGERARKYVCANYHGATGVCDQKPLDAVQVDAAVVEYLDRLFIDVETWAEELAKGADAQRSGLDSALAAAREKIGATERLHEKVRLRWRKAIDAGNDAEAEMATDSLVELKAELADAREQEAATLRALAALEDEPTPTDAALDLYNELAAAIRSGGDSLGELNERLRGKFEEFRLDQVDDETVGVQPVLRVREMDADAALREWIEAGEPDPTPEEVADYEAVEKASVPIWAGKRPPAMPLAIVNGKLTNHHAYLWTKPKRLALAASQG